MSYRHYRCQTSTSFKDWLITTNAQGGLSIYFGGDGKTLQLRTVPAEKCLPDLGNEYQKRINQKVKQGYFLVSDNVDVERGRPVEVVADAGSSSKPRLHGISWELLAGDDSVYELIRDVAETMAKYGCSLVLEDKRAVMADLVLPTEKSKQRIARTGIFSNDVSPEAVFFLFAVHKRSPERIYLADKEGTLIVKWSHFTRQFDSLPHSVKQLAELFGFIEKDLSTLPGKKFYF